MPQQSLLAAMGKKDAVAKKPAAKKTPVKQVAKPPLKQAQKPLMNQKQVQKPLARQPPAAPVAEAPQALRHHAFTAVDHHADIACEKRPRLEPGSAQLTAIPLYWAEEDVSHTPQDDGTLLPDQLLRTRHHTLIDSRAEDDEWNAALALAHPPATTARVGRPPRRHVHWGPVSICPTWAASELGPARRLWWMDPSQGPLR